jgi:integrase/recombinase XerD
MTKKAKTLTPTELRRVLDHIATRKHAARNRVMLLLTHWAGLRVGEVAALRYCDVLAGDGSVRETVLLSAEQTKGRHARTVFLSERVRKEIAAYVRVAPSTNPERALFYTQKNPLRGFTANTLAQFFLGLYRAARIDGASSHSGRRTFATTLASKGVGVRVLMRAMGHRNISTTIGYVDANDDMLRKAVELV